MPADPEAKVKKDCRKPGYCWHHAVRLTRRPDYTPMCGGRRMKALTARMKTWQVNEWPPLSAGAPHQRVGSCISPAPEALWRPAKSLPISHAQRQRGRGPPRGGQDGCWPLL